MMFYKRFIGDYRKKTARLTPLEHGVYGLLLDEYYATEGPLPLDAGELANIVGARTNADNAAIQKVLDRYFTKTNAGWVNDRGLEEMDSARKFSAEQKARIEKRWNGKGSGNTETVPDEYRSDTRLPTRPDEKLDFEPFKAVYPQRSGAQPWAKAVKAANARIKEGAHFSAMVDGARRYAAFCEAADKAGTEYVMQAATFLGPEQHFLEAWDPPPSKAERLYQRNLQHGINFLERDEK